MTKEEAIEILTDNWTTIDNSRYSSDELNEAFNMAIRALKNEQMPSAENTAEWIYDSSLGYRGESHYKCSVCGKRAKEKECNCRLVGCYGPKAIGSEWICDYEPDFTNYCSNCGAKMKGK